jgi:hypothetical protein
MKRILVVFLSLLCILSLSGCKKDPSLVDNLSELRSNVYFGEHENYSIKAVYGFKEKTKAYDGKIGEPIYKLSFKLNGYQDQVDYTLSFNFNGKSYEEKFNFDPVRNCLMLDIEIDNFNLNEFTVNLKKESQIIPITLKSIVPENTLDYKTALLKLMENQPDLINSYKSEKGYDLEIQMRITVKKDKPYWFVGLTSTSGDHKVLLLDGYTGNALAVRDVF